MKNIIPIQAASQKHLLVADITEDIILTKEGGAALVLQTSALNFSLLSEKEQSAMIYAYAALLNSLSFPAQILIRSQKKDVSSYLDFLKEKEGAIANPKLKEHMASYMDFVANIVKKRNVLEKEFLIVIPFSPFELGVSLKGVIDVLPTTNKRKKVPFPKEYVVKKAKTVLYPRRDHIIRQSGRLGIKIRQLTTEGLADLFLDIYESGTKGGETGNGQP